MVINHALHPHMLDKLCKFKGEIFNPQFVATSPLQHEHRKVSSEYSRIWMKEKGPKLFLWLVGVPSVWGSFLIWAAASDSIASKVGLALATVTGVAALVASVVRDRSTMTIEELDCFLPAFDCTPVERLYLETFVALYRSKAVDETQLNEVARLLDDLLDLEYVLIKENESIGLGSVETIENQLNKVSRYEGNEEIRQDLLDRLEQARNEQPMLDRIASTRVQIESSLIGLRHDLARSDRLTSASLDPLGRAKELLDLVNSQAKASRDARDELDRFVTRIEPSLPTKQNPSADIQQRGSK